MADGDALIIGAPNQGLNVTQLNADRLGFQVVIDGEDGTAIVGEADADGVGVNAQGGRFGVYGVGGETGVRGEAGGTGVYGEGNVGVWGHGNATPPTADPNNGVGVRAESALAYAVYATSDLSAGVYATSRTSAAIRAESAESYGVSASGGDIGAFAENPVSNTRVFLAGRHGAGGFYGDVHIVNGDLYISGVIHTPNGVVYRIDHPLDPANRYLSHSAVASSEAKNVYDGVANLDGAGTATVDMPNWFESLNGDLRYQLTSVGGPAPDVHIANELTNGRFTIAGGLPNGRVSWLVTGVRRDPSAVAHPEAVEMDRPEDERGSYVSPELFGEEPEQGVGWRYPSPEG